MGDLRSQSAASNEGGGRAELIELLAREVGRLDDAGQKTGATSWVLTAALAFLFWAVAETYETANWIESARIFGAFAYLYFILGIGTALLDSMVPRDSGAVRFRPHGLPEDMLVPGLLLTGLAGAAGIALLSLSLSPLQGLDWAAVLTVAFIGCVGLIGMLPLARWFPLPNKPPSDSGIAAVAFRITLLLVGLLGAVPVLTESFSPMPQSGDVKLAMLVLAIVLVLLHQSRMSSSKVVRDALHQLEIQLSIGDVSVDGARPRIEALLLGVGVEEALRPWVQSVVIPFNRACEDVDAATKVREEMRSLLEHALTPGNPIDSEALSSLQKESALRMKSLGRNMRIANKAFNRLASRTLWLGAQNDWQSSAFDRALDAVRQAMELLNAALDQLRELCDQIDGMLDLATPSQEGHR